ncbi:lipocalin family protein [Gordonia sp. CPCC 205515]|uniref:lipocalin family protein n=1 Tax=Gordonia sp. CPCC 205515 TaxID=3140791 RepID=UPI003AF3BF30
MRPSRRVTRSLAALVAGLIAIGTLFTVSAPASAAPLQPVAKLDPQRYLGQWWQLATVPSFYGVRCAKDTNATYTLINKTTVGVNNRCTSFTGQPDGVTGKAYVLDTKTNAQLNVQIDGVPKFPGMDRVPNYIVAWTEDGKDPKGPYEYAIVGDPTRTSGFLLSRKKVVSNAELHRLRTKVESVGFNSCTFLISPTTGGRTDYSPLCTV